MFSLNRKRLMNLTVVTLKCFSCSFTWTSSEQYLGWFTAQARHQRNTKAMFMIFTQDVFLWAKVFDLGLTGNFKNICSENKTSKIYFSETLNPWFSNCGTSHFTWTYSFPLFNQESPSQIQNLLFRGALAADGMPLYMLLAVVAADTVYTQLRFHLFHFKVDISCM